MTSIKIKNKKEKKFSEGHFSSVSTTKFFDFNAVFFFVFGLIFIIAHNAFAENLTQKKAINSSVVSEFDNPSDGFVISWRNADSEYEDTSFGELIYNEPSTSTKLEMLRLLSKDTPSTLIFIHAVSMGLGIDEMLQASVEYSPEKARDLGTSAVSLLPLLNDNDTYRYSAYRLNGLNEYVQNLPERKKTAYTSAENSPYSIQAVVDRFFNERLVLRPFPDWFDGQAHFMATAKQLSSISKVNSKKISWYYTKSSSQLNERPIFISLYEHDKTVLVDGHERIQKALAENPNALLPVVFIYNRLNERAIGNIGYPETLTGLRDAYAEKKIMVTPTSEWQTGEYHVYAELNEFYELFDIPKKDDFETQAWDKLLSEARSYQVNNTSLVAIILGESPTELRKEKKRDHIQKYHSDNSLIELPVNQTQLAAWDDPRTEGKFKFTSPKDNSDFSLNTVLDKGIIINRPDLVAALKAIGVLRIPVSVYYLDSARVKSFTRGPRSLIQSAVGVTLPITVPPGGRVTTPLQPASPPGLP